MEHPRVSQQELTKQIMVWTTTEVVLVNRASLISVVREIQMRWQNPVVYNTQYNVEIHVQDNSTVKYEGHPHPEGGQVAERMSSGLWSQSDQV